jgi:hypothetical protein
MDTTTTHMSEADYETVLTAAAELGRTEPFLDGTTMFQRLGVLPADNEGGYISQVNGIFGSGRRTLDVRRAYLEA